MLATLNLQFSPVEITEDSLLTSTMTPGNAPIAEFAELLRLRVDTVDGVDTGAGQGLPQGGSDLPLQALPVELDAPELPQLNVLPKETFSSVTPVNAVTETAIPEAAVPETAVPSMAIPMSDTLEEDLTLRPAHVKLTPEQPASLMTALAPPAPTTAPPANTVTDPVVTIADSRDAFVTAKSQTLPVTQPSFRPPETANPQIAATLAARLDPGTPVRHEPVQPAQVQTVVATDVEKSMPLAELPRRAEVAPPPAINVEEISEVFKARPTVTQPVQVLSAQPNPQQAVVIPTAPTAVNVDTGFAAAVQQASDLISVPLRDAAWAEQIGERVLMMAGRQMTSAEIRLTPAEMGPLRVQVSVDDGAANVTFQAQHAVTREAIEQALPRLRELLAESGLSLGQASVGEQGVAEGKRDGRSTSPHSVPGEAFEGDESGESAEPRRVVASDSLVDTFV